ncbi:MAG: GAF domain-containing protein [Gemmatimonadetes bacterium]|nr:GAF domain-containing protein [Gemmatimonadota bacterium]
MSLDAAGLVLDLQEMRDQGHQSDAQLRKAVRTIAEADDRFDWVGIYLVNAEEEELWLHNYIGTNTEHARIPFGRGVCGRAHEEGVNLNIADVTQEEEYLACSADTRSEVVVLIRAGDDIFGQIDIDSHTESAFGDEDEAALTSVADKLAEQLAAERRSTAGS